MELTNFRQRVKDKKMVSIHVMNKDDALYVEDILYKYGYYWYARRRFVDRLDMSEMVLDVNYDEKGIITYSEQPDDRIHNTGNLAFFSSQDIKKVEGIFNDRYLTPSYKPKKIERTI